MKETIIRIILLFLLFSMFVMGGFSREDLKKPDEAAKRFGSIRGVLKNSNTKISLTGAKVSVLGTELNTTTDANGGFHLTDVPVGAHSLQFSLPDIQPMVITDVIVKSNMSSSVAAEMSLALKTEESITVSPSYFSGEEKLSGISASLGAEEIRRASGAAGDISRIIAGAPSLAKVSDEFNTLIVRGGSADENLFLLDNMEIPNINHFPAQGSGGGPISLLNSDFLQDVEFSAGGFPVTYGDKLSSVMNIRYREGNRDKFEGQGFLDMTGAGMAAEGPFSNKKGSWMVSARRSFLDLLSGSIEDGNVPKYSDIQGKIVHDLGSRGTISFLGIGGWDNLEKKRDNAIKKDDNEYGREKSHEYTVGANWTWIWGPRAYSETSFSHSAQSFHSEVSDTATQNFLFANRSDERTYSLRNTNHFTLNEALQIYAGFETKRLNGVYRTAAAEYIDSLGNTVPSSYINSKFQSHKVAGFGGGKLKLFQRLSLDAGFRADYFGYNNRTHLSPRMGLALQLTRKTTLSASGGIYYQNLTPSLLVQNSLNRKLKDPRSVHFSVGINHLLTENTRLTIEAYKKTYKDFAMDPSLPQFFPGDNFDESLRYEGKILSDCGKARAQGVEITLQKKLKDKFFGTIGASIFNAEYLDMNNTWKNRSANNRYVLSMEGGYKPNRSWLFSGKWILAGGRPYTPIDVDASAAVNSEILDATQINARRLPAYHSLSVRVDKQFYFKDKNLTVYFDVWNAYNRNNIREYYWNEIDRKLGSRKQWEIMPILGIRINF